ncbi:cyclic nucleotide-binding domain-containing thioredoxin-disulfide reductase [Erythrobacter sp. THAF29]|uniref:cyclic nucleotide-binding domain-containing thioredoxin-disulfide reductase n=1 Tax=Erythrobacter sp. THAF29 TaxID=2587851 RepID=UPI0012693399|nr:cyclic nucleotide-binding domain-containing thioredoxin-disulfide reductase [Erythrobacter sp. THAF29]QFT77141.1 Thioredoxin reductase [Erythrobacter sp. THAF29]
MEQLGEDLETMRRVPLADDHVAAICEIGQERTYAKGEMVAEVGDPMDTFVYVLDGEIEVVDPYNGERLLDASLGPTQFMGEIGFLNRGAWFLGMRAATETKVIEAPREAMLDLMSRVPELSDHIITVFAARRRKQFELRNSAVKVIGADRDSKVQAVERFLSRNRIPFESYDMDATDRETAQVCDLTGHQPSVVLGKDQKLDDPTPRKVAQYLGLDLDICSQREFDLLIVGGGPAGVAAAVYAGSEGLDALVIEDTAVGGQAGTSSRIENYMGFPTGISGTDLTYRGQIQALKFGTKFVMPRRVVGLIKREDGIFCAKLDDDDEICAASVLVSTGVQYRRLPLDNLEHLEGAGVFYSATEMEARFCSNTEAVVIGGGNSAGQAAMYLSRAAAHVHLVVRSDSLAASMSSYLTQRLEADPKITIHYNTEVTKLHGDDWLDGVTFTGPDGERKVETRALFIMIGAAPNTDWLSGLVETDEKGFVLTGDAVGRPTPFETGTDGIFAVGDVRAGSVKRVASAVGEGSVVVSRIWSYLDELRNTD